MPKKTKDQDVNQLAASLVQSLTDQDSEPEDPAKDTPKEKNPAAVALGRLGGLKGGVERAKKLSKARLKAIARKAAETRWKKKKDIS